MPTALQVGVIEVTLFVIAYLLLGIRDALRDIRDVEFDREAAEEADD